MRATGALIKILRALLESGGEPIYGFDMMRTTGLKSGTVYTLLDRLADAGWVTGQWETIDPRAEGRPRRRLYRLTAEGQHEGRLMLLDLGIAGGPAWA